MSTRAAGGGYVNFMMDEGQERVWAACGDNHERLVEVKSTYRPTDLFRVDQEIGPREGAAARVSKAS
jgi:hypothetical protein